ncbi:MAG TPA: DUF5995 family protein [Microlunatus sp.]|nr:DUF5995 family protein [Microlunatus sp.]
MTQDRAIESVMERMQERLEVLPPRLEHHRVFLSTYRRTTRAVGDAITSGVFGDPGWVGAWDVAFAELYLAALDAELAVARRPSRPWRLAFAAPASLPPLRHVLFGINAHINYDLPQALLAVISADDFDDPDLIARRRADHERIDGVLSSRVSAEEQQLSGPRTLLDRALTPLNRQASRRFLREARQKVWNNTTELNAARRRGAEAYAMRLAELEVLSAAKIDDLRAPGQVLLRLAVAGFGVTLPPVD